MQELQAGRLLKITFKLLQIWCFLLFVLDSLSLLFSELLPFFSAAEPLASEEAHFPWLPTASQKQWLSPSSAFFYFFSPQGETAPCQEKWPFPGELSLISSWSPNCILAVACCTFLILIFLLSKLKIFCIITEIRQLKQEGQNSGENWHWDLWFSSGFLFHVSL